jgi:type I restriction enzyme, S subunit
MARAIFKSWFVDFDVIVSAPLNWRNSAIGNEVTVLGGSTPSTTEARYWGGRFNFLTPRDMSRLVDSIILETERAITAEGLSQISSGLLGPGTVLLSSRAPIGYLAITEVPVAVNQGFIAMVCDRDLPNYYVLQWARHNMDVIIGNANGTTFLEISKKNFRPIGVLVPPREILDRFVDLVRPLYKRIAANLRESKTLTDLRDALLPKLLSGEVRVKQAEKIVGGAL